MVRKNPVSRAPTAWARSLARLIDYAEGRGLDRAKLLSQLDVERAALDDADRRVPSTAYYRAIELCSQGLKDPYFGMRYVEQAGLTSVDAVGFLALASRNVGEALDRYVRHHPLVSEADEIHVDTVSNRVVLRVINKVPRSPGQDHVTEMYAAGLLTRVPQITGKPLEPISISFTHPCRGTPAEYRRWLGREPKFDAKVNEWVVPKSVLEQAMPRPDASLTEFFEKYLDARAHLSTALSTQVRGAVADGLVDGAVSLARVAKRIAMTPRTLQRRLAEEGLSFEATVDDVRQSRAKVYLDLDLPLAEVSYLLGYSDPATFHRAFKRWTDMTPLEWKKSPAR